MTKRLPTTARRSLQVAAGAVDLGARTVEVAFASETPVHRGSYIEVLAADGMSLERINTGAAVLMEHDPRDQIGCIVAGSVTVGSDKVARGVAFLSQAQRVQEILQDVADGIRSQISVGYTVDAHEQVGVQDGVPVIRVTAWTPFEVSFVSIAADVTQAGVGRSADMQDDEDETVDDVQRTAEEIPESDAAEQAADATPESETAEVEDQRAARAQPQLKKESVMDEIQKAIAAANARAAEILALGARHKADDMARDFVASGKSVDEFRSALLERAPATPVKAPTLGLSEKEKGQYSLMRAIRAAASRDWSGAGFEREAGEAMAKALGRSANGFFVPLEALQMTRASDQTAGSFAGGGALVPTELRVDNFIGSLMNRTVVRQLGATVFDGLQGDVAFPKQLGLAAVSWVGEDGVPGNTNVPFGHVPMSPRTITAKTSISRKLMLQTAMSVEAFLRNHLADSIALGIDHAALVGGTANAPQGLFGGALGASREHTLAAPGVYTYEDIVALETMVAEANADNGSLAYLTTPGIRGTLKTTPKAAGVSAGFVWEGNELNGQKALVTNQLQGVRDVPMAFGNWADMYLGFWSGLDVVVDNLTDESGATKIRVYQDCDIALARAESFAFAK